MIESVSLIQSTSRRFSASRVHHILGSLAIACVIACGGTVDHPDRNSSESQNDNGGRGNDERIDESAEHADGTGGQPEKADASGGADNQMRASGGAGAGTCTAPFDPGPCDGEFSVYWFNPLTLTCDEKTYGGCEGNENRFETLELCETVCRDQVVELGISCRVDGVDYLHGAIGVPDATSCNTCTCEQGTLTSCTETDCPDPCPEGSARGERCALCGPPDCAIKETGCFPTCTDSAECDAGSDCLGGLCLEPCEG